MVQSSASAGPTSRAASGVQSVHRALDLVEILESAGGQLAIGEIAARCDIPLPTIHRLLRTLVERGYVRQMPSRRYALGFRFIPVGAAAGALVGTNADTVLADLVATLGESANLAVLSGDHAEYVAQVPSRHSMRMFTEVGRRVEMHCTGVGKALLAQLSDDQVDGIVRRVGLTAHTPHTLTDRSALGAALQDIRDKGYALDEQEQELGVRCVAVPIASDLSGFMAVSVSGPVTRMTDDIVEAAVPLLREAAARIAGDISTP